MRVDPVLHRVLVKPDKLEEMSAGGIVIPHDKRKEDAVEKGTVISVGSTAFQEFGSDAAAESIYTGQRVYFAKYSGKTIQIDDEKYFLLNDEDICGVIHDE